MKWYKDDLKKLAEEYFKIFYSEDLKKIDFLPFEKKQKAKMYFNLEKKRIFLHFSVIYPFLPSEVKKDLIFRYLVKKTGSYNESNGSFRFNL